MPEPVVVTAVFIPAQGRKRQLVDALAVAIAEVHEESGCVFYALHDAEDGTIVMIEKWDSAEQLAAHAAGDAVARLDASIAEFIAEQPVVTTMAPLPAGTAMQGQL
jgi:quinol monooxygenase YgiN